MDSILNFLQAYSDYAAKFLGFITDKSHRFFGMYLLASLAIAYVIYVRQKQKTSGANTFLSFLFPKSVWSTPTAWLDVRYFFFHGLIGHFLLFGVTSLGIYSGLQLTIGMEQYGQLSSVSNFGPTLSLLIAFLALIIIVLVGDFLAFFLHFMQHKIPLLWQFHKVHHSGEVMHPLSNFREHPIDNLTYDFFINLGVGLVFGSILMVLGYTPTQLTIFGFSLFSTAFNLAAYQFRHSHIWLKWPGIWSKVFGSPAHHHVHHSRHPDHLDKNFAFMFPMWDLLFKTYVMPEDNRDVEFGIVEDSSALNSCVNLYVIPFRDAYRVLKGTYNKGTYGKEPVLVLTHIVQPEA